MAKIGKYQADKIEAKWQNYWRENNTFAASDAGKEVKKFIYVKNKIISIVV